MLARLRAQIGTLMADGYLQNLMNGGYVGNSYYSGADPSAYVAPLILSSMQSGGQGAPTDTFQYYQSMFNRVQNAAGYTPGTLTDSTLGSLSPNNPSAASQAGNAVGSWIFSQIMTPRFIIFAVGGVLIIVALFSMGIPQKTTAIMEKVAAKGAE
jgi:hypothetical protein